MAITTEMFLERVKSEAVIPTNQVRFSDDNLLAMADQETKTLILPMLLSLRQEYLVKKRDQAVTAGAAEYKIPYRAVGRTLRDLRLKTTTGNSYKILPYVSPEDEAGFLQTAATGEPRGFTVRGDKIVLLPTPGSAFTLELFYELTPARMVKADKAGVIAGINTSTGAVSLQGSVAVLTSGAEMDVIDHRSGNMVLGEDLTCSNVSGTLLTFAAADLPSDAAVGNYVALSGQTPVSQLPDELTDCLVTAVAARVLRAQSDFEGMKALDDYLKRKLEAAQQLFTPRVESQVPTVLVRNGILRRSTNGLFRHRYTP